MITETRQSRTRLLYYEHRRPRRRHHTLDNATLDQFNFICVPLHRDETRTVSSSSHTNLTMTQPSRVSVSTTTTLPTTILSNGCSRRVRFNFDQHRPQQHQIHLSTTRQTRSFDDVRVPEKHSVHRVEFQIPIHRNHNPWLNVQSTTSPAKTRSLTSQKIDIKPSYSKSVRLQGIAPFVQAEINSQSFSTNESDKSQSQWYRQMYGHLHKPPETKQDQPNNPYKPTYTFPDEFSGDSDHMEDYIRKTASQNIEKDNRMITSPTVRPLTSNLKDPRTGPKKINGHTEKTIRFEDHHYSSPITSPSTERQISSTNGSTGVTSPNSNHTSPPDDEQKLVYKRVLRGGEIPSNGLQKLPSNNRAFRWQIAKPIKKTNNNGNHHDQQTWVSRHEFPNGNRSKPQPRPNTQPIYKALALHSFYAQTNRELSFKKGDIILVLRRINDDWLEGELEGCIGIFPLNHVELFPMDTNEPEDDMKENSKERDIQGEAIVKFDFIPQKTFELQLRKGDKVILLRRLDENWYEGRLNHLEGIFPAAYVETLREPPEISLKKSPSNEPSQPVKQLTPSSDRTSTEKSDAVPEATLPLRKCQVLYDYTPQNPDELEIHVGDIINIIEMCDDGWYCGIMEKSDHKSTMEFGTFPGNYVQLLPEEQML